MKKTIKIILLVFNFLFLVLLLGATMAGWKAPSKGMLFSFLCYGYLYFLIANIVFVLLWLCWGSKWFLLSLVGVLVRFTFIPLYFQVGGTESLSAEELQRPEYFKLLTYNLHSFKGVDDDSEAVVKNMGLFLEMVDAEDPDVLVLQEYVGKCDTLNLTEVLQQRGYLEKASARSSGGMQGEVIFSKMPVLKVVRIHEPTIFYADLLHRNDTLRVFCMHLSSYGLDGSDQQQLKDLRHGTLDSTTGRSTYHKFRETLLKHEEEWKMLEPYFTSCKKGLILAGDFNDPPASYFYQQCKQLLKDSYCEAGQGFSTTYHGIFTKRRNAIFPSFRIDMVLHTPDIEACSYKRIKSEISDHYPVVVGLRKQNREQKK